MTLHRTAHRAMGTAFEVLIEGEDDPYAARAARAAVEEVDRLEATLSRFIATGDVARIARLGSGETLVAEEATVRCLAIAERLWRETDGAFDVTVGPLREVWRGPDGRLREPAPEALRAARARVGMEWLVVDEAARTVTVRRAGVTVDPGAIGKGFALDRAAAVLGDWDVGRAFLSAGRSTVLAVGTRADGSAWPARAGGPAQEGDAPPPIHLRDRAFSGSGPEAARPHVFDPRTGRPALDRRGAWAAGPSAAESDALATAFLVMAPEEVAAYCQAHREVSAMLATENDRRLLAYGT